MIRPVLHDKRFAMPSDWQRHAEALEEYATKLEGGIDLAKSIIREQNDKLAALGTKTVVTPAKSPFDGLFEGIFGPPRSKS